MTQIRRNLPHLKREMVSHLPRVGDTTQDPSPAFALIGLHNIPLRCVRREVLEQALTNLPPTHDANSLEAKGVDAVMRHLYFATRRSGLRPRIRGNRVFAIRFHSC